MMLSAGAPPSGIWSALVTSLNSSCLVRLSSEVLLALIHKLCVNDWVTGTVDNMIFIMTHWQNQLLANCSDIGHVSKMQSSLQNMGSSAVLMVVLIENRKRWPAAMSSPRRVHLPRFCNCLSLLEGLWLQKNMQKYAKICTSMQGLGRPWH